MLHVFVDEAGDLGFSKKSSKHFVIAALATRDPVAVRRLFRKIRQRKLKKKLRQMQEFKFSRSNESLRKLILERLAYQDIEIAFVAIGKIDYYSVLLEKPEVLYRDLVWLLINHASSSGESLFNVVVDQSLSKPARDSFDSYLNARLLEKFKNSGRPKPTIEVVHINSMSETCLQAADFVVGAVFSKHERGDDRYYRLLEPKVKLKIEKWLS